MTNLPAVKVKDRHQCGLEYVEVLGISSLPDPIRPARELIQEIVRLGGWVCFWYASPDDAFDWGEEHKHLTQASPYHYIDGVFQHAESTMWVARSLTDLTGASYDYPINQASWIGILGSDSAPDLAPSSLSFIPWPAQPEVVKHWDDRIWPRDITCLTLRHLAGSNDVVVIPGHESEHVEVFGPSPQKLNHLISFLNNVLHDDEWFRANRDRLVWDEPDAQWKLI